MQQVIAAICRQQHLRLDQFRQVFGGDINRAFCIETAEGKYFLKLNQAAALPGMFACEAEGLKSLEKKSGLRIPIVIGHGENSGTQWLLLQWIEKGTAQNDFWEIFGRELAALHRQTQPVFGFFQHNYIGSLRQSNSSHETWAAFYAQERILPLVKKLADSGHFGRNELQLAQKSEVFFHSLFPAEPPSLLHGDLWSGNFMCDESGLPCIYDPAVYYGHREMDIAMTLLFGGFDKRMYAAYQEAWPLENGWRERVRFCQLYPLLVHAVLFEGHYVYESRNLLKDMQ